MQLLKCDSELSDWKAISLVTLECSTMRGRMTSMMLYIHKGRLSGLIVTLYVVLNVISAQATEWTIDEVTSNSSMINRTCPENQRFCEETLNCSQPNYECNGCKLNYIKCPDGKCVTSWVYSMKKCAKCWVMEYECPGGQCIFTFDDMCPSCRYNQRTCPDLMCAEEGEECPEPCPAGLRRCANGQCVKREDGCLKPCFSEEKYCSDEKKCRGRGETCKCGYKKRCKDGSCRSYCYEDNNNDGGGYHYDNDDNDTSIWEDLWVILLLGCALPISFMCRQKRGRKPGGSEHTELVPVGAQPATQPLRPPPQIQNVPSHYPVMAGRQPLLPPLPPPQDHRPHTQAVPESFMAPPPDYDTAQNAPVPPPAFVPPPEAPPPSYDSVIGEGDQLVNQPQNQLQSISPPTTTVNQPLMSLQPPLWKPPEES